MNKRSWFFVTAPFIVFTIYTFFVSFYFPDAPQRIRWLVTIFLGLTILLLIIQKVLEDGNYFVPTLVVVLFVNWILIFSTDVDTFDSLDSAFSATALALERPQLILYSGLFMMALVPPLFWGGSFTSYFSRLDYPEGDWMDPDFLRANRNISYFWVLVFLLCFATQFVPMLLVQLLAPILIVMTLGAWGTKKMIEYFISHST